MEGLYENRVEEEEFTEAYIQNMYQFYGYGIWVVCLKENDRVIGRAGLSNRQVDGNTELELGYVIEFSEQHKGYAIEACTGILKFAKEKLDAKRVVSFIRTENVVSRKLIEKLGFQYIKDILIADGDVNHKQDDANNNTPKKLFAYYIKIL